MDLVRRHINRDFRNCIDFVTIDAEFGRNAGEIERTDRGNIDLEPRLLGRCLCGIVRADDVVPDGLERGSEVRGERKRTARILQTGNVAFPHKVGKVRDLKRTRFRIEVRSRLDVRNNLVRGRRTSAGSSFNAVTKLNTGRADFKCHDTIFLS